jgi:hypothetical protein
MTAPFTFTVYPATTVNGVVTQWNAVVYDMREVQRVVNGKPMYRFVKLTRRAASPQEAANLARALCAQLAVR